MSKFKEGDVVKTRKRRGRIHSEWSTIVQIAGTDEETTYYRIEVDGGTRLVITEEDIIRKKKDNE